MELSGTYGESLRAWGDFRKFGDLGLLVPRSRRSAKQITGLQPDGAEADKKATGTSECVWVVVCAHSRHPQILLGYAVCDIFRRLGER